MKEQNEEINLINLVTVYPKFKLYELHVFISAKELSLCSKLWFFNFFIFATQ